MMLALAAAAAGGHVLPASAQDAEMEEVTVTARQQSAATDILQERIEQQVVVDLIGADQIARVGDSTVSLALRRLPGVTLVNDQFIYIRGLGERYSSTTLNGAYVPSPDLTRNVIPLDLFPAEIIDSISIQKGYTADRPAAFGGGNVDIRTRSIPEAPVLTFQIGTGWDSEHSRDALTYSGGGDDKFGTDDGTRALPGAIAGAVQTYLGDVSPTSIYQALLRDGGNPGFADAQAINRELATSLNRDIDIRSKSTDPDLSLEASAGNSWTFGAEHEWRFGVLGLADYKNQWRNRDRTNRAVTNPDENVSFTERTTNQVALTGSLNFGLAWHADHEVSLTGLYLRNTDDEASIETGNNFNFQRDSGDQFRNYRIRYEERDLELYQLGGRHTLGQDTLALLGNPGWLAFAENLGFAWYYSDAKATTDIPNETLISARDRIDPATGQMLSTGVRSSATAGDFRFTDLTDEVHSYGWKLGMPFAAGDFVINLSGGYDYYEKGRRYLQTQLGLGTTLGAAAGALNGTPGEVFTDEHILDPANGFQLSIGGIGTESYLAAEVIDAAFGQFDIMWKDTWRVAGGVRYEEFNQLSVPVDPLVFDTGVGKIPLPIGELATVGKTEDDWYPALALTHMRPGFWAEDFQLRFGWSQTAARPDLREISQATYIDPLTEARVRGNANLVTSELTNYDVRAEWFFAGGDNFTITAFYKDIERPIETVEGAGTDDNVSLTFINAESAEVYGLEVEWLKSLGFLANRLGDWTDAFFVSGNVTYSDSEITIGEAALNLTNNKRRLSQQADYVMNLQVGYDSPGGKHSGSLVYNSVGERVFFAGRNGAPDAFEQPFNSLDLVYNFHPTDQWSVKLRLQNLLDDNMEIEQGGVTVLEQDIGMTYKLDASYRF